MIRHVSVYSVWVDSFSQILTFFGLNLCFSCFYSPGEVCFSEQRVREMTKFTPRTNPPGTICLLREGGAFYWHDVSSKCLTSWILVPDACRDFFEGCVDFNCICLFKEVCRLLVELIYEQCPQWQLQLFENKLHEQFLNNLYFTAIHLYGSD